MASKRYKKIPVGIFNEQLDDLSLAARGLYVTLFTDERLRPCGVFRLRKGELADIDAALWAELSPLLVRQDRWIWIPSHAQSQGSGPKWDMAVKTSGQEIDVATWDILGAQADSAIPYRYPIDTLPIPKPTGAVAVAVAESVSETGTDTQEKERKEGVPGKKPSEKPDPCTKPHKPHKTERTTLTGKEQGQKVVDRCMKQLQDLDAALARYKSAGAPPTDELYVLATGERLTVVKQLQAAIDLRDGEATGSRPAPQEEMTA